MDNYIKGANVEEEITAENIPIPNLPKDFLWMKVGVKLLFVNLYNAIKRLYHSFR